jgi:hypothetical protein
MSPGWIHFIDAAVNAAAICVAVASYAIGCVVAVRPSSVSAAVKYPALTVPIATASGSHWPANPSQRLRQDSRAKTVRKAEP